MATYSFSTITSAQALAFNATTDTLSAASGTSLQANVSFDDPHQHVTVSDGQGHTVVFGAGIYGARIAFPEGQSVLFIGSPGGDVLAGGSESDNFYGGDGADTIISALGGDRLFGGPGADLFDVQNPHPLPPGNTLLAQFLFDWESKDSLYFSAAAGTAANYREESAPSEGAGQSDADALIRQGALYVAVGVGADVYVFANSAGDHAGADTEIKLLGRTLADIDFTNFVGGPAPTAPVAPVSSEPTLPDTPFASGRLGPGRITGNMDTVHIGDLHGAQVTTANFLSYDLQGPGVRLGIASFGLSYDSNHQLLSGATWDFAFDDGVFHLDWSGPATVDSLNAWIAADATQLAFSTIFQGSDQIAGSDGADLIRGYAGHDYIGSGGGNDTVYGGDGDDVIVAGGAGQPVGSTYLRGEAGDDYIRGGDGFDDINGNQGNDTLSGGNGDDWVVGGKDNDLQFGGDGDDIVWGNLGADTLEGGAGADQIRGGQGDDILFGDAGNDYISGDRGNDTETGGAGADLFHSFSGAGIDRVLDFNPGEGDRVMLDPGTAYTVKQVGADTVVDMGNGDQMILVGVQMSTLPAGWIFLG